MVCKENDRQRGWQPADHQGPQAPVMPAQGVTGQHRLKYDVLPVDFAAQRHSRPKRRNGSTWRMQPGLASAGIDGVRQGHACRQAQQCCQDRPKRHALTLEVGAYC